MNSTTVKATDLPMNKHQPRERPVPCPWGGVDPRTLRPRCWTWNLDGICDAHRHLEALGA